MTRVALLSMHSSPLTQPGSGDSGGMNVYVRELAAALAHQGNVCVIYTREPLPNGRRVIEIEPGVTVVSAPAGDASLPKEQLAAVADEWADKVEAEIRATGGTDVLHANYWLSGLAGHRLKHRLDLPLVSTFHTLGKVKAAAGDIEPLARAHAEQAIMNCSDMVLANCEAEARQLIELYSVPRSRIAVVAPGVDHALFSPGTKAEARRAAGLTFESSDRLVLFVGRFQALKGLDLAVEALAALARPEVKLVCCGGPSGVDGEHNLRLVRKAVESNGLESQVTFVAPRPHVELSSLYRAADVVIVPSRSESFGLVALEAAACATPVVAANVGGLGEIVQPERTGLLVTGRDPLDWARALDSALAEAFARKASLQAVRFAEGFSWTSSAVDVAAVYSFVVDRETYYCAA